MITDMLKHKVLRTFKELSDAQRDIVTATERVTSAYKAYLDAERALQQANHKLQSLELKIAIEVTNDR